MMLKEDDALALQAAGMMDGYSTGQIPADLDCLEDRLLWQRMTQAALLGLPPASPAERLLRALLAEIRSTKGGPQITRKVLLTGMRLAVAQTHGIPIRTHARGIARHLEVRYQTLLKVRSTAVRIIKRDGICIDIPDWLKWDWG